MTTIAIQRVTDADICSAIRETLAGGELRSEVMANFLAEVDWSGADTMIDAEGVTGRLGQLEGWTTELQEGDLSRAEYRRLLRSLLPDDRPGSQLGAVGA